MNNILLEVKKISNEISINIFQQISVENNINFTDRHLDSFSAIEDVEIEESIVIFGLNPSSSDIDTHGVPSPCFLHYVPEGDFEKANNALLIKDEIIRRKYTYDTYFKKPYNLFYDLNQNFMPIWKNIHYLNKIKLELNIQDNDSIVDFLFSICSNSKRFIIFSDLVQYREKSAKKIEAILSNSKIDLKIEVIRLFELQLKLYKAKYVFINNAYASHLIHNYLKTKMNLSDDLIYSCLEYNGIKFIFSSLVTGVRALDLFNFARLRNEIKTIIN